MLKKFCSPLVNFNISYGAEKRGSMRVFLVRGGEVIKVFEEKLPMEIEYKDQAVPEGKKLLLDHGST